MGSAAENKNDNLTAVLYGQGDLRLEQRPVPVPKDDEVLIRMAAVGICGSDVHYLTHGRIGDFIVKEPMVIGHEAAGTVVTLGKNVTSLKVGDRVAIEPGVSCRKCRDCKRGEYNLCKDVIFCATPPVNGNLARYYCHPADFCWKLPENVSLEEGALLEPLSVGVHSCLRAGVGIGSRVLITGAGPIGLVSLLVAKTMGCGKVVVTDIDEGRLKVAREVGAGETINVGGGKGEEEIREKVREMFGGEDPDVTIDCCGMESTIRLAMICTRSGGSICIVGYGPPEVKVPIVRAVSREVNIRGIFRYANCYPKALSMVSEGNVNVKRLITHNFKLEETAEAFETARTGKGGAIKVMIHC